MFRIIISLLSVLILFQAVGYAQADKEEEDRKSSSLEENVTRALIEREEEKHRKLVTSAGELNTLAQQLCKSAQGQRQLTDENQKKLNKIEKIAKQIRSEQGGNDGDYELENPPQNLEIALERLQQATDEIEKELGKISRHGISITLIVRTNDVIALTKTIKKIGK
ncbi:MAG: hypothetical protein AB1489_21855 [Acidobacteriota bacterium]